MSAARRQRARPGGKGEARDSGRRSGATARARGGTDGHGPRARYVLRLYVAGASRASRSAVERVREICQRRLKDRYELEVIDIYQLPALARNEQIIATPTLIRVLPAPLRRYIGDLSRVENVFFGLDLRERSA